MDQDFPADFDDVDDIDLDNIESISQRMDMLNNSQSIASQKSSKRVVNPMDFYSKGNREEESKSGKRKLEEDDEAVVQQLRSYRKPGDAQVQGPSGSKDDFGGFGDFDDLPSVKSRDLMSQCESASDAKSLATPAKAQRTPRNAAFAAEERAAVVHNETPMIERDTVDHFATVSEHNRTPSRNQSIVSFGSE